MKSVETVKEEKRLRDIKKNSFFITQMIGRKFAAISNDSTSTELYNNLKYKTFEMEDADKIKENENFELVGYISAALMNKMHHTQNLFTDSHIKVIDKLNNMSYVFVDA